jgi:hypothetical protein
MRSYWELEEQFGNLKMGTYWEPDGGTYWEHTGNK